MKKINQKQLDQVIEGSGEKVIAKAVPGSQLPGQQQPGVLAQFINRKEEEPSE